MKFYLVKNAPLTYSEPSYQIDTKGSIKSNKIVCAGANPYVFSLTPIIPENGQQGLCEARKLKQCAKQLMLMIRPASSVNRSATPLNLKFILSSNEAEYVSSEDQSFQLSVRMMETNGWAFNGLLRACGVNKVKVGLEMRYNPYWRTPLTLCSKDMYISTGEGAELEACIHVAASCRMAKRWMFSKFRFNIILAVDDDLDLFKDVLNFVDTTRIMLEGGIGADFEIVASNGAVIKCHKSYLMVHSPVMVRMLESGMSESLTNRMSMPEMSEDGVRAFLAFLYCGDWEELETNPELVFELLKAAHMYGIEHMQAKMLIIFERMPSMRLNVDFALKLFMFVRQIPGGEAVKKKTMRIINMQRPAYYPEYQQFRQDHPEAVIELYEDACRNGHI